MKIINKSDELRDMLADGRETLDAGYAWELINEIDCLNDELEIATQEILDCVDWLKSEVKRLKVEQPNGYQYGLYYLSFAVGYFDSFCREHEKKESI